ncbi:MAG TPA: FtsX-like permease family protein [Burkholderiales bacterium]|nr:FtsX-like permease family protein [Burkholderiales bacterium]
MIATLRLAWRLLWREWRAGELYLIAGALAVAVAGVTAVGFFSDRVNRALDAQAGQLLGADLALSWDRPLPADAGRAARAFGLATAGVVQFPSMALAGGNNVLAEVKAVGDGYPLRGAVQIATAAQQPGRSVRGAPRRGTVWIDSNLQARLGLAVGSTLELGDARFSVAAIITRQPDAMIRIVNLGPRLLMNRADLPATGLTGPGARARYQLLVAGNAAAVAQFRGWAGAHRQPGQRIEGTHGQRGGTQNALERAERFLGLAALVSMAVAAMAIGLAVRRFMQRHLDAGAVMRCVGASRRRLFALYGVQLLVIGLLASAAGCVIGIAAQLVLAQLAASVVKTALPAPGWLPLAQGMISGTALLLAFALPALAGAGSVPPLRVLRHDAARPGAAGVAGYALTAVLIAALVLWQAGDWKLGGYVLAGFAGVAVAGAVLASLIVAALVRLAATGRFTAMRYGIAGIRRRGAATLMQTVALSVGIMAILLMTLVYRDLMQAWQHNLPADAPNRFLIGVQPDQVKPIEAFFKAHRLGTVTFHPMVRGRLTAINGRKVTSADYADERAQHLIDREFNLSWADAMQAGNRIVAGHWWQPGDRDGPQFSMESGIAKTLGIGVGDKLTFDIAGQPVSARVTSLRDVDWDSFNVNFFVIAPPGMLDAYPASYITSFHLAAARLPALNALIRTYPNVVAIDVGTILAQVRDVMNRVTQAVSFVFLFTLLAGVFMLYAAIASTRDERLLDAAVMRALGARRGQILRMQWLEFALLGALAGLLAAAGATVAGSWVGAQLFHLAYGGSPWLWVIGMFGGALGVALAAAPAVFAVVRTPPLATLRRLG